MTEKLVLFGIGYVLGTRAGRERYHELVKLTTTLFERAEVRTAVALVTGFLEERAALLAPAEPRLAA